MQTRAKIAAKVFAPVAANRQLVDEPLTADDWRKVWEARQSFLAAIRQVVFNARCREAERGLDCEVDGTPTDQYGVNPGMVY